MNQNDIDVRFEKLSYANEQFEVPESLVSEMNDEFSGHSSSYLKMAEQSSNAKLTPRNVRLVFPWTTGSIRTNTEQIDQMTDLLMNGNFADMQKFVQSTTDGQKKWEKVHKFWSSDIPEQVAEALQRGNPIEAKAVLGGLSRDEARTATYARPCKASLVTELLGDTDSMCIDSRRYNVLKPLLTRMLPGLAKHPETAMDNPFRQKTVSATNELVPAATQDFLQEKLMWNPQEYTAITRKILDVLEAETDVPRECISHVLFNLGGERTFHDKLMAKLE